MLLFYYFCLGNNLLLSISKFLLSLKLPLISSLCETQSNILCVMSLGWLFFYLLLSVFDLPQKFFPIKMLLLCFLLKIIFFRLTKNIINIILNLKWWDLMWFLLFLLYLLLYYSVVLFNDLLFLLLFYSFLSLLSLLLLSLLCIKFLLLIFLFDLLLFFMVNKLFVECFYLVHFSLYYGVFYLLWMFVINKVFIIKFLLLLLF